MTKLNQSTIKILDLQTLDYCVKKIFNINTIETPSNIVIIGGSSRDRENMLYILKNKNISCGYINDLSLPDLEKFIIQYLRKIKYNYINIAIMDHGYNNDIFVEEADYIFVGSNSTIDFPVRSYVYQYLKDIDYGNYMVLYRHHIYEFNIYTYCANKIGDWYRGIKMRNRIKYMVAKLRLVNNFKFYEPPNRVYGGGKYYQEAYERFRCGGLG